MSSGIQNHPLSAYLIALSKLLERGAYYGARALLVLFLMDFHGLDISQAFVLYGTFTMWVYIAQGIGGALGDFVIGNKVAILVGAACQVGGLLVVGSGNIEMLDTACIIYVIGAGLHGPNLMGEFGKLYLQKRKLMDAGMTLMYVSINLGAFLGVLYIGQYVDNFQTGFYIAAGTIALSVIPLIIAEMNPSEKTNLPTQSRFDIGSAITMIAVALCLAGFFWTVFEWTGYHQSMYNYDLKESFPAQITPFWLDSSFINGIMVVLTGAIGFIVWSNKHISQFQKIFIGFTIAVPGYLLFYLLPDQIGPEHTTVFLAAAAILTIAEVFISIAVFSVYALIAHPKRIATVFGIGYLATSLFHKFIGTPLGVSERFEESNFTFLTAILTMSILAVAVYLFRQNYKPRSNQSLAEPSLEDDDIDDLDELGELGDID